MASLYLHQLIISIRNCNTLFTQSVQKVALRACFKTQENIFIIIIRRDNHDPRARLPRMNSTNHVQPIHFRQIQIDKHDRRHALHRPVFITAAGEKIVQGIQAVGCPENRIADHRTGSRRSSSGSAARGTPSPAGRRGASSRSRATI